MIYLGTTLLLLASCSCIRSSLLSIDQEYEQLKNSCMTLLSNTRRLRLLYQDLKEENEKIAYKIRSLKQDVNDVDTFFKIENLEIMGVPKTKGENLMQILQNISSAIDLPFNSSHISAVWRKHEPTSRNYYKKAPDTNSVIVRFVSRSVRSKWLKRGRKKIVIYSKACLPQLPDSEIYINEHLINSKKSLIKKAKGLEAQGKIPYAWLKDGHLYIRRTNTGKAIKIKSEHDLRALGLIE